MKEDLIKLGFKGEFEQNVLLKDKTFFKIGGPASLILYPKSLSDLLVLSKYSKKNPFSFIILGLGSNILIHDEGIATPIIFLSQMPSYTKFEKGFLKVSANTSIRSLLRFARENGLRGFEFLCGIPGNVGGSVFMNAGTHLGEIAELLESFTLFNVVTGKETVVSKNDFDFHYRKNAMVDQNSIITEACFKVDRGEPKEVQDKIYQSLKRRKESQPLDYPSCGSVFKNPEGHQAWKLIEDAGLKGHRIGDAEFSNVHSNWIINLGKAKASDVVSLIELAQERVLSKFNISLIPEVQKLGY